MPVQRATTAATSSSSTSSFTIEPRLLRVALLELLLERRQLAVADLGDALEVALALRPLGLHPQRIDLLRDLADPVERLLLARPARGEPVAPLLRLGELGLERRPDLVRLAAQRGELDLELRHAPVRLVELDRRRLDLHLQPGSGLVDEVDRLVRAAAGRRCSARRERPPRRAPRRGSAPCGAPRSAPSGRAGSRSCRRRTARRRRRAGSAARARRPSRCACGTRRASSRRRSGARHARASA